MRAGFLIALLLSFGVMAFADPYTFTTIDAPGALWTSADGINDAGQTVGYYDD